MSIVQSQIQATLYFALNKSSRGKRTLEFNGPMIISKDMERKEGRENPKGKAKKEEVIRRKGRRRGRRKLGKRRKTEGRKTEGRRTGGRRRRRSQSKCICRYM